MVRRILIVEDDTSFGQLMQNWFKRNGFETVLASGMEKAKEELSKNSFCLLLSDLRLPDGDGIMLLTWIKERKPELPVIIMTSYAEIQSAVSAMKLGAFDFLEKPINPSILKEKIDLALSAKSENVAPKKKVKPSSVSKIVEGNSETAVRTSEYIRMVAPTRMSVLILGESGTGKEYTARLIHENSTRKDAPFIAVDCGSLSRELAPSELFGHLKGSFTSAISDKKGVFEQADGGTVFLDEVGNLSYEVQIQLLRALQERKIRPVGSAQDIQVDIRLVAATNEKLEKAIIDGKFREDLFHRLNEFSIEVPPLRDRVEDIPMFALHFLEEANEELGKHIRGFSDKTLQILKKQRWSGNLRELRNVVRRAVLFAQTDEIVPENLPVFSIPVEAKEESDLSLRPANEREQIEAALRKADGNKTQAARLLKIDRKTLYNKLHQYGIEL